jgi:hypothetical protein
VKQQIAASNVPQPPTGCPPPGHLVRPPAAPNAVPQAAPFPPAWGGSLAGMGIRVPPPADANIQFTGGPGTTVAIRPQASSSSWQPMQGMGQMETGMLVGSMLSQFQNQMTAMQRGMDVMMAPEGSPTRSDIHILTYIQTDNTCRRILLMCRR